MNRILMIAYHFPPIQGSSGLHRTVQFARHLPKFGWEPLIMTVHPRGYPKIGNDYFGGLPEDTIIKRAFTLDSARHLSIKKRYLGTMALPDRWISWWPHGVWTCLKLIKKYKPSVIWSTFPIATAHLIALTVQRLTGLPWVADFRDPMIQEGRSISNIHQRIYQWIEKKSIKHATKGVFVTDATLKQYTRTYPKKNKDYWHVIENGYDEDIFQAISKNCQTGMKDKGSHTIKLVHSGLLYSKGRNPELFFRALQQFIHHRKIPIQIILRAPGKQIDLQSIIASYQLEKVVKIEPSIPYENAITEMLASDGLLLFQGSEFNSQVPAKVYEYIRTGKPILALTDKDGETACFLRKWDGIYFGDLESPSASEMALSRICNDICLGKKPLRKSEDVNNVSREAGTKKLAKILSIATNDALNGFIR